MTLRSDIGLAELAIRVGDALRKKGIRAVLTGGACAHIRSGGVYTSSDADYVLTRLPTQSELDHVMTSLGFERHGDRYEHPDLDFFVEFPPGPLAIGADTSVRPALLRRGRWTTEALSATDSCRDRLAAFYHWSDRQAFEAAVAIAIRNKVRMQVIRQWSEQEGASKGFDEFAAAVRRARATRRQGR